MAFILDNFAPAGQNSKPGAAPSMFTYHTMDTHATLDTAGYFNAGSPFKGVYNMLNKGDIIDVVVWTTAIGTGAVSTYGRHIVKDKAAGVLDVGDVTVGVVTDTD